MTSITALRQELRMALGTNYPRYMSVMRDWFASRHNRQDWEFDMPFLSGRSRELHNRLMVSILQLCMSPNFEVRKTESISIPPVVPQLQLPNNVDIRSKGNVMTLHAAPEEEATLTSPVDCHREYNNNQSQGRPSITSLSISEEDTEIEEDGGSEESKVNPLFVLGLRKATTNELNERPLPFRHKADQRIPPIFLNEILDSDSNRKNDIDMLPNVTHRLSVKKYLDGEPELRKYFRSRQVPGEPLLSTDASLPGKILLKAWESGIRTIDPQIIPIITRAAQDRVTKLIHVLIMARKGFKRKSNGQIQFEEFHTNPYLLSKHHIPSSHNSERRPYSTLLVNPITLPPDLELQDKNEQLAALRGATSIDVPFRRNPKINPMEVYLILKSHPHLNLGGVEGQEVLEKLLIKGSGSLEPSRRSDETEDMEEYEEGELLPVVSY